MDNSSLPFEVWKTILPADFARNDRLLAFDSPGNICLQALWEAGIEPNVAAILNVQSERKAS